ncbi:hypothetical protein HPB47_018245 [Ixodes persulcatus]|uniref:Uncharacterized protein n=1 Tax=Ixodes persulcatus TaxID=34615 RepID=A0AC60QL94_IXOPE|nr:hypothetical protein HPB47_018245 [Ixodes persulcatus]
MYAAALRSYGLEDPTGSKRSEGLRRAALSYSLAVTRASSTSSFLWNQLVSGKAVALGLDVCRKPLVRLKEQALNAAFRVSLDRSATEAPALQGTVCAEKNGITVLLDQLSSGGAALPSGTVHAACKKPGEHREPTREERLASLTALCHDWQRVPLEEGLPLVLCAPHVEVRCCARGPLCTVSVDLLTTSVPLRLVPLHPVPVLRSGVQDRPPGNGPDFGFAALCADRLCFLFKHQLGSRDLPLVGVWVSGVDSIQHPFLWLVCAQFLTSRRPFSRASDSLAKEHIARLESRCREQNQRCKGRRQANATDDDRATEAKRKREARRRLHSTPAEQFPGATARFRREFVENPFGVTCAVCDRLWPSEIFVVAVLIGSETLFYNCLCPPGRPRLELQLWQGQASTSIARVPSASNRTLAVPLESVVSGKVSEDMLWAHQQLSSLWTNFTVTKHERCVWFVAFSGQSPAGSRELPSQDLRCPGQPLRMTPTVPEVSDFSVAPSCLGASLGDALLPTSAVAELSLQDPRAPEQGTLCRPSQTCSKMPTSLPSTGCLHNDRKPREHVTSQGPEAVYELIRRQDEQLRELRLQLEQLLQRQARDDKAEQATSPGYPWFSQWKIKHKWLEGTETLIVPRLEYQSLRLVSGELATPCSPQGALSVATQRYLHQYGLLDPESALDEGPILDISALKKLPKLL